ncbi:magnesium ion transporter [Aspergillus melleus]|uniref:Magnesium ion transporter n=1 Tax=Aspergillus melleus TaxID=138277 RepID=A0ACC3AT43_9EURO|nr:magnesium ion transporter [Aspergillus melleus]
MAPHVDVGVSAGGQTTIQSILDVRRDQTMVLEAEAEICMLGLAAATLMAGLYGMNVPNYCWEKSWAFGLLVSFCLVGTVGISRYGMRQLRRVQRVSFCLHVSRI